MTIDEMIRCAGRELGLRRAVYPKWVEQKRMNQAEADFEISCMDAIYSHLKAAKESSPPPPAETGGAGPESAAAQSSTAIAWAVPSSEGIGQGEIASAAAPTDEELIADIEKRVKRKDFDHAFDLARGIQDQDLHVKTVERIDRALAFVAAKAGAK
jgi:hypothetical protein